MASDNTITLVGNITDDPELRFTPSGAAVANFTVAVNRRFKNQSGAWEDKLDGFFRCSCWREMAENVAESLTKGSRVMVVGRLQQRKWETSEGQTRYDFEIQVDEVGPSLRWATASPQKTQRSGGQAGGFGGGQGGGQGGNQAGYQQQGGNQAPAQSGSPAGAANPPVDWTETPSPVGAPAEDEGNV